MSEIVVIGAGIAGLTAAYELQKYGFDVQVIEASPYVGGRMKTDTTNGYIIDCGAQFLSTAYSVLNSIIVELGLQSDVVATSPWTAIQRDGVIRRFRYDDLLSPAKSGLLNWGEWLKLGLMSVKFSRLCVTLPVNDYSKWARFDDENAASWYNRQYGRWMTEYIIEPMLEGFYFQLPDETSRALPIAVSGFLARGAKTITLKRGIGSLADALADRLDVVLNEYVEKLSVKRGKVFLRTGRREIEAERVILAVPAYVAQKIYTESDEIETTLMNTPYASTVNIAIGTTRDWDIPEAINGVYGLLLPRRERKHIAAIAFETSKHPNRVRDGQLLNVMLDGKSGNQMIKWGEEEIFQTILLELDDIFVGISENVVFRKFYRWKYAEPKSPVGRATSISRYRKMVSDDHKVLLAGDYMGMPFTEGAAETGMWAASRVTQGV